MKTLICILVTGTLFLVGCGTPGNLASDRADVQQYYAGTAKLPPIHIVFEELPGETSDGMSVLPGISATHSVNADKVAYDEAMEVFSLAFSEVDISVEGMDEAADVEPMRLTLRLKADASISSMSANHVAMLEAMLHSASGDALLETSEHVKVKDQWQYAQYDTMQRAFIGAYRNLIEKIRALPSLD